MPKKSFWNIGKANAEITAADSAIDPALAAAKISVIKVDGRDIPAHEAPLADKITALLAVAAPQAAAHDMSELVVTNDQLSKQIDRLTDENVKISAGNAALTQENVQLKADLETAKASIASLTASEAELSVRHEAALSQVSKSTEKFNNLNREISAACLKAGCLDVSGENEAEKLAAADAIEPSVKLAAYAGAVNTAVARIGVTMPAPAAGGTSNPNLAQTNLIAKLDAIKDPVERAKFFRENKAALATAARLK